MKLIGVDLYQHLLGSALRTARGETVEHWAPELNLGVSGSLPEAWIPEADVRLTLYSRLARMSELSAIDDFEAELEDRFGALPPEAERLLQVSRVRMLARLLGIARIDAGAAAIALTPRADFAGARGVELEPSNGRLLLRESIDTGDQRLERVQALLEDLLTQ
jgi:transcription-repair coupling factor (superfamily II helicase)